MIVLEFSTEGDFDEALLLQLSDQTREAALDVFPKQTSKIQVLTRESLMDFVQQQGKDSSCLEGECAVDIARNINARFAIVGNAYFQNGTYRVTLKAFDSQNNTLLGQEDLSAKNGIDLLNQVKENSLELIEENIGPFDPGRKGIRDFRPDLFDVPETSYRVVNFSDELLPGAQVKVTGGENVCITTDRNRCSVLVDTAKVGTTVEVDVLQDGYRPIHKTVDVSAVKADSPVSLKFIPVYGMIKVSVVDPYGKPCNGSLRIDGEPVGDTPYLGKHLAKEHTLVVDCRGMGSTATVLIEEQETATIELAVQPFSLEDYENARRKLFLNRALDWGLFTVSGTTASLALSNFSKGQQAFLDASSIESAAESVEYQGLLETGDAYIRTTNVNLILCGISAGLGASHTVFSTRKKKEQLREIEEIRCASTYP